ncbi:MFS transporter, partial [Burkholderia cenocepacia]|uniref:MFS transporter n=1 Tax=Burkholderia cenocepacia TaxID=95486 RepID=UPI00209A8DA1
MLIHHIEPSLQDRTATERRAPAYAWLVFGLTVGLLLSDYMSRQVLNAVFPLLKHAWALSDTQLGSLSGVVALLVGLLTFPLSVLADRFGRVRSIVLMAALWSVATLHNAAISTMLRTRPKRSASTDSGNVSSPTSSATTPDSEPS